MVAGRGAPEWLGGLGRVWARMGLRLVLGGEESFVWGRSTEPTSGLVELRTGWNLVGWSGADGAPLEQVARGIGWSLREVRRWDAANQRWEVWTSPERSAQLIASGTAERVEPVTVRRGEGLWVKVARAVNWLQPTGVLPRLVFPGGASDELRARVREDLESVLAFYGQQYGIQADPDFTVYVAKDVEALIQAQKDAHEEFGDPWEDAWDANARGNWKKRAGWADWKIVVKQNLRPESLSASEIPQARYTLTHEYFHILQRHLQDNRVQRWLSVLGWLSEGTATWAEDEHQVVDGEQALKDLREQKESTLSSATPMFRSILLGNALWGYTLGWLAVDRLSAAAGNGSYIEFWRRLAPTEIGPYGRWTSTPDLRTAFQETFGVLISSFYTDFNVWQREQAAANGTSASSTEGDARWIQGQLIDENGAPIAGVFVSAIRIEGGTGVGWAQHAETDINGAFAVKALQDGDYRISVNIADNCTRYYSDGKLTEERDKTQLLTVVGADLQDVNIQLPSSLCSQQIRGQVVNAAGGPLVGTRISICQLAGDACATEVASGRITGADGSFAVTVPTAGAYRLRVNLSVKSYSYGCSGYYIAGGLTTSHSERWTAQVAGRDVRLSPRQIPAEMRAHRISGRFADANGAPLVNKWMNACRIGCMGVHTGAHGRFDILVPADGAYSFHIQLQSGPYCGHGLEGQAFRSPDNPVRVRGADVTGITLWLPGTVEELCG